MASPKRKVKLEPGASRAQRARRSPTLTVHAFKEPLTFEAYIYEASPGNDGFVASFQKVMDGSDRCDYLTEANFTKFVWRRDPNHSNDPNSENTILHNTSTAKKDFWRGIMIRYPNNEGSSPETREEGLQVLKSFLMDPQFTDYPPSDIETMDATNMEDPPALDEYFLDHGIKAFLTEDLEESDFDPGFYDRYTEFAQKCWSHSKPSKWALKLGFPDSTE